MVQSISNTNHLGSNLIQPIEERRLSSINYKLPCRLVTVRKSGSSLMANLMNLIGIDPSAYKFPHHLCQIDMVKFNERTNYIISVRDPRDMLVSLANWAVNSRPIEKKIRLGVFTKREKEKFWRLNAMTTQQRVHEILLKEPPRTVEYKKALALIKKMPQNIHIIKFEDIVGPERGGSPTEIQLETIHKIAMICGHNLNRAKLDELSEDMIGGSGTYTNLQKKVGQWKTIFTADDIRMVKQQYNKYILAFGYETDPDWDVPYLKELNKQN